MKKWMVAVAALAMMLPGTVSAQDGDLAPVPASEAGYGTDVAPPPADAPPADAPPADATGAPAETAMPAAEGAVPSAKIGCVPGPSVAGQKPTYDKKDILAAGTTAFGKGAEDLANVIEKIFKDNGEPNGYIAGREAGGAIVVGLRYGSGTMTHKVEGNCPVFWTGPSLGFDLGANAAKVFVLVYNLYDTEDLYHRFGAIEGQAYFIGGFTFAYLRRKDVVLVPVRLGVGLRLGANVGYMKFSKKSKWLPF